MSRSCHGFRNPFRNGCCSRKLPVLLEATSTLEVVGLRLLMVNGTVRLTTSRLENDSLKSFLAEQVKPDKSGPFSEAALEVLACIAFKQPVSQAEIDLLFGDVDKRHLVNGLREAKMVEDFVGPGGRLQFTTTGEFLRKFGITSPQELQIVLQGN